MEITLASDLQPSAHAHVAASSCSTDTGRFNIFAARCGAQAEPRVPLPASDATKESYLLSVVNDPKMFATVAGRALSEDGSGFETSFEKRKNAQFIQ